ncbi:MAG: alpha-amylase family glycosyl hydrolase [Bacteroidia bacterium]
MKKNHLFLSILFSIFWVAGFSQAIVTLDPPFPTSNDAVTITFNADQGNAQLADLPDGTNIFAHTGITVDGVNWQFVVGDWATVDNRVLMTRVGTSNQYTLQIPGSIRDWYANNNNANASIPSGASITKLCMVFRNAAGTLEGKTATNGDIFVDLATSGFSASITSHPQNSLLLNTGESITFTGQSSAAAALEFTLDDIVVGSEAASTSLNYMLNSDDLTPGLHTLIFEAIGSGTVRDTIYLNRHSAPTTAAVPSYGSEGIIYPNETTAYLQLRAPFKGFIYVLGDFNNWSFLPEFKMNKTPDGQYFWIEIPNLDPNREYRFQYYIDWEGIRVADPYCEKVLDPWNDPWINESTYPNLIEYPSGITEGIVGVLQTRPEAYVWDNSYTYSKPPKEDLVIYEMLVRDFTEDRTFAAVIEKLPYIATLGVNAIELMPVAEFDGNESWGYAPSFCSAVDKYYGPKNELKRLVDSCHARGIAVISDVVFNHVWGSSPLSQMYFNNELGQPAGNSPWLNQTARHPFNVGYDMNHESPATKFFVKKHLKHWIDEFRIDGYRFDLSKGFTQTNSGQDVGGWSNYDQGRVNILLDYAASIRQTDPSNFIIFEHFGAWDEEIVYANDGAMLWGYGGTPYSEAAMGWPNNQNLFNTTPQARGWGNYGLQTFMESHDEERLMYKNINFGNASGGYDTKNLNTALDRMEAAASFFIVLPGPKMMWQFGELGYDVSINDCGNGTINEDCRTSNKPVRWEYYNNSNRKDLFEVYRKLIYLKKTQPSLRDLGVFMDLGGYEKVVRFTNNDFNCVIVGNFDVVGQEMNPGFPFGGIWYDYLNNDSLDVSNPGNAFNYGPGEYHVYTDRRIVPPTNNYEIITTNNEDDLNQSFTEAIIVYPNPVLNNVTFKLPETPKSGDVIQLSDITGRVVISNISLNNGSGNKFSLDTSALTPGIYIYTLSIEGKLYSGKIIKQ